MKSWSRRSFSSLATSAALTFVLLCSRTSAQTVAFRADPNPPTNVTNVLYSISAHTPSDVWAVGTIGQVLLTKHWNGSSWSVVGAPYSTSWASSELLGVSALAANAVWAVGDFTTPGTPKQAPINSPVIEHFNGASWSIIPSPQTNPSAGSSFFLSSVSAVSANDVWAVGFGTPGAGNVILPLYEHWNGNAWTAQFGIFDNDFNRQATLVSAAATSASDVRAAGSDSEGALYGAYISHWNGKAWSRIATRDVNAGVGNNSNFVNSIRGITANDAWAVGSSPAASTAISSQTLTLHWDGRSWKVVPSPNVAQSSGDRLQGVTTVSSTNVWAAGAWADASAFAGRSLVEHWDGSRWSIIAVPTVAPQACSSGRGGSYDCTQNFLASITSLPTGHVWAAGQFNQKESQGYLDLGLILDRP